VVSDELADWQEASRFTIGDLDDPLFRQVKAAAEAGDWLDIAYFGGSTPGDKRRIRPLQFYGVEGYSDVYVRAFCDTRGEERSFRLDRIAVVDDAIVSHLSNSRESLTRSPSIEGRVLELVNESRGITARQVADQLGLDKRQVNSALYGRLRGRVFQDNAYRWWPLSREHAATGTGSAEPEKNTPLARLCRYYLDCLAQEDGTGISAFASSRHALDYAPLEKLPLVESADSDIFQNEFSRRLLRKVKQDRGRLQLYVGYPTRLNLIRSRTGWEGLIVEPVFLFPLQFNPLDRNDPPTLALDAPQVNFRVLRALATTDSGNVIDEAIQLSEALGLNDPNAEIPQVDDLVARLRQVRADWDWREEPDPYSLSSEPAIGAIEEPGIYNRAVLIVGERSQYTQGLESELAALAQLDDADYRNTALGEWLEGKPISTPEPATQPLLEILPLNTEQRQAVLHGLSNSLTVITGPPGTGKSQVVTSLLANAAWQAKKVLFASKNNKAVDVVELRTNAMGPRPLLLRLGANQYQNRLAEYLVSLLAASTTEEDEAAYENQLRLHNTLCQRFGELESDLDDLVRLRNEVDRLERSVEHDRAVLGIDLFEDLRSIDPSRLGSVASTISAAVNAATRSKQSFVHRSIWPLLKTTRYSHLSAVASDSIDVIQQMGLSLPTHHPDDSTMQEWSQFHEKLRERLASSQRIGRYYSKLQQLVKGGSLEALSRAQSELVDKMSESSEQLWHLWLRLQPSRMNQEERRLLSDYSSLLQMIVSSTQANQNLGAQVFRQYHKLFPKITGILSCWAVTSLSARGRIPLEPGFFDLLVIDEASQCDIASVLPLLYRAKRAVIIGDPQQLKHISSLSPRQETTLLAKHDLVEGHATWAYSQNSLFNLASGLCQSKDIILLRDHHRSHADIIGFSNERFYENRLRIATKYERLKLLRRDQPAVRWIDVRGKVTRPPAGGAVNPEEAAAVVQEIERLVRRNYRGTIGVVTPFRSQANLIRDLVHQNEALVYRLAEMDFLANTVHLFQGDERDLMVFSPVVSTGIPESALRFLSSNRYLFNVAVTRARSALLVVGDQHAALDSGVDYLKEFASYVSGLRSRVPTAATTVADFGPEYPPVTDQSNVSDWERLFYRVLYAAGIKVVPQYGVDQYALDFALFNDQRKLDIEVDGERYHRDWDGEQCRRDQIRDQRLMELGWDVMRFWVYQIRDDMDGCIARVQRWLH